MRVAMYYPWIYLMGGIERTILEIAQRSRHDWTVFTSHFRPDDTFPGFRDLDVRTVGEVSVRRDVGSVFRSCLRLLRQKYDWSGFGAVMISCDGVGNLVALRSAGVPLLCLCHTPLKVGYDPHARRRWTRLFRPGLATRGGVALFKQADRIAWRRYQHIFCVSAEVERRLQAAGVVREGQTEVLHPGVDVTRLMPSGRREPYFLLPGRIMWSKNIELGIESFVDFKRRGGDAADGFRLKIAGMIDEKSEQYFRRLRQLAGGRNDVDFVPSPSDDEMRDLYDAAHAVLFTPPNEDWGIVPLEAMAFAKPVIAVGRGGPAESIVHGECGFLCRDDPVSFAEAMLVLATDEERYRRMSAAARKRAERYDWSSFVGRIDDYLDNLASHTVGREALAV